MPDMFHNLMSSLRQGLLLAGLLKCDTKRVTQTGLSLVMIWQFSDFLNALTRQGPTRVPLETKFSLSIVCL